MNQELYKNLGILYGYLIEKFPPNWRIYFRYATRVGYIELTMKWKDYTATHLLSPCELECCSLEVLAHYIWKLYYVDIQKLDKGYIP
jgi:hypothetical protein